MSNRNKNINQLFEALKPETEQKEKMFQNILSQSPNENIRQSGATLVKRFRPAVLAAVLAVCLTTTAFAAAYMGLDEAFIKFLNPVSDEQAQYLSNGAYVVDKKVVKKNGTLTIKQVIGDSNLTYVLMDFTAPKGTVLDAARYRFEHSSISADENFYSTEFKVLDDGNPNDNKFSLLLSIMTKNSIAGQTAHFEFKDLQAADPFPGIFETIIPGIWKAKVKLDFKEYSTNYPLGQNINMYGYDAVLKSVSVSPISITLKIDSGSLPEISEAARNLRKNNDENEHLDTFPITVNYTDGTSETTTIFNGLHLADNLSHEMLTIKTFENVINDKEIVSIVFFDQEILIGD